MCITNILIQRYALSTYLGLKKINNDDIVIFYTDTFYEKKFITKICKIKSKNIVVPVSSVWEKMWKIKKKKLKLMLKI